MKYAFIVMIALYLVTYGCSPDSPEKETKSHKAAVETKVEATEHAPAAIEHQKTVETATKEASEAKNEMTTTEPVVIEKEVVVKEQQAAPATQPDQVVTPCGQVVDRKDLEENGPPCMKMRQPDLSKMPAAGATEEEVRAALDQVVQKTNEMVLATRQLIIATEQMLEARVQPKEQAQPEQQPSAGQEEAPAHQ